MLPRQELIQRLTWAQELIKQQKCSEGLAGLNAAVRDVIRSRFFPLLDVFLAARMSANLGDENFASYLCDAFIRLSPHVRTPNPASAFQALVSNLDHSVSIDLVPEFHSLFPVSATVAYDPDRIVAGQRPTIHITVSSSIQFPIDIDSISVALTHDNRPDEELLQTHGVLSLGARSTAKFSAERTLPPAIAQESVKAVVFQFKDARVRVARTYCPPLHVSPDASACKIEWELPKRCIIGADIRLLVRLEAADQRLTQVQIWFNHEHAPITISGRYRDVEIGRARASLPDIEPFSKCELELSVRGHAPVPLTVDMVVAFGTALSGTGKFKTPLRFNFESPFEPRMRFFDASSQELSVQKSLYVEIGSFLSIETSLTNRLETPVRLLAIDAPLAELDLEDVPVEIGCGETFTFVGRAATAGIVDLCVQYESELVGKCAFTVKSPQIEQLDRPLLFTLDAPSTAVRYRRFDARVIIEKNPHSKNDCNVNLIAMDIQTVSCFYVDGPTKKTFAVFAGEKTVVPISFLPLEAGSTTLPQITFTEVGVDDPKPKKFLWAIVVSFD